MSDTLTTNQLVTHVSALLTRSLLASRMSQAFNGKRDYNEVFGYPPILSWDDYWSWYERGGLAKRIIDLPCDATWRHDPEVLEDANSGDWTLFRLAFDSFTSRLNLIAELKRADILQSVGRYSIMLLGVKGTGQLEDPLPDRSLRQPEDLVWVDVFDEKRAQIEALEEKDVFSPQYRLPLFYQIDLGSSFVSGSLAGTKRVHYSRVLHFAEGCLRDRIFGTPRLQAVYNLLMDLLKVSGGGAEAYWLNAINGVAATTREGWTFGEPEERQLTEEMENFVHQLSRTLLLKGADVQRMGVQTADPTGTYTILMDQLAGTIAIPQRILTGSEMGQLASSQDRDNWNDTVMGRQNQFAEPGMLRKFIDRGLALGFIPPPRKNEYIIKWKDLKELSSPEKATLALTRAQAASTYVSGSAEIVYAPSEFREDMGKDPVMPADAQASIDDMRQNEPPLNEQNPQVQAQFTQGKKAA